nr:universal stress protein [uncultured Cupriavidus sp.]
MFQSILVAIDGSRSADLALDKAIDIARAMHARIEVLHVTLDPDFLFDTSVMSPREMRKRTAEYGHKILGAAEQRLQRAKVSGKTTLLDEFVTPGQVPAVVCAHAESIGADLLVCGTHGLRGIRRLVLGSVSEGVVRQARSPVLLVRSELPG